MYYRSYLRAIGRFIPKYLERRRLKGLKPLSITAEEMMDWWLYGRGARDSGIFDDQMKL
jgi:hypothetical protein